MANCLARSTQLGKGPTPTLKHGKTTVPATSRQVGKVYMINRKQADDLGKIVIGMPILIPVSYTHLTLPTKRIV